MYTVSLTVDGGDTYGQRYEREKELINLLSTCDIAIANGQDWPGDEGWKALELYGVTEGGKAFLETIFPTQFAYNGARALPSRYIWSVLSSTAETAIATAYFAGSLRHA